MHLRQRKQTKDGKISLYLEIYKGTKVNESGKIVPVRDYEYLKQYLIDKPKNAPDRQQNKEYLELANSIRAKRELEIKNGEYGFTPDFKNAVNFIDYFQTQVEKHKQSNGSYGNWDSAFKYFKKYAGTQVLFKEIDEDYCERFMEYLKDAKKKDGELLSSSAVSSYYNKFKLCLKEGVRKKIILSNPSIDVKYPKVIEAKKEYLTIEELQKIARTESNRYPLLRSAFLFACLTGLRKSDVQKLKWSEVEKDNNGWRITFHQKKTKGLQYLPINQQARELLGVEGNSDDRVFTGLRFNAYWNLQLREWMMKAGITKHITWHCARVTHATILISEGADLYVVKEILGHADIRTTEIYARVIGKRIKDAVNLIPSIEIPDFKNDPPVAMQSAQQKKVEKLKNYFDKIESNNK